MAVGRGGPHGVHVPRSVEVDFECARDHVTLPNPNMVVLNAGETTTKPFHVTQTTVLVIMVFFWFVCIKWAVQTFSKVVN